MARACSSCGSEGLTTLWASFVRPEALEHCPACLAIQRRKGAETMTEITGATVLREAERLSASSPRELAERVEELGADGRLFVLLRTAPVFEQAVAAFAERVRLVRPAEHTVGPALSPEVHAGRRRLMEAWRRGEDPPMSVVQELWRTREGTEGVPSPDGTAPLERMEPTAPVELEADQPAWARTVIGVGLVFRVVGRDNRRLLVGANPLPEPFRVPGGGGPRRYLAPLDLLAPVTPDG